MFNDMLFVVLFQFLCLPNNYADELLLLLLRARYHERFISLQITCTLTPPTISWPCPAKPTHIYNIQMCLHTRSHSLTHPVPQQRQQQWRQSHKLSAAQHTHWAQMYIIHTRARSSQPGTTSPGEQSQRRGLTETETPKRGKKRGKGHTVPSGWVRVKIYNRV